MLGLLDDVSFVVKSVLELCTKFGDLIVVKKDFFLEFSAHSRVAKRNQIVLLALHGVLVPSA